MHIEKLCTFKMQAKVLRSFASDLQELQVQKMFIAKYRWEFVMAKSEFKPDCGVNH